MSDKDMEFDPETGEEIVSVQPEVPENSNESQIENNLHGEVDPDEDDPHGTDEPPADGEDENEREAIRERRRQERARKKQALREREDTLRRELAARDSVINELRSKVDQIEQRNTGTEIAELERTKKQIAQAYNYHKDQIRIAVEAGNGAAVADATEKMQQAQREFEKITSHETALKSRQAAPQATDPQLVALASDWINRNSWYAPNTRDIDSRIAKQIDEQLTEEGWNPRTKEYWEELDSRIKKYLPHRATSGKTPTTKPKSVVSGSGREGTASVNKNSYTLSAERVKALRDAGIYDDPKMRADAIRRYREYDAQNKG